MYTRTEAPVTKPSTSRNELVYLKVIVSAFKYLYPHSMDGPKFATYWYLHVSHMLVRDVDTHLTILHLWLSFLHTCTMYIFDLHPPCRQWFQNEQELLPRQEKTPIKLDKIYASNASPKQ